MSQPASRKLTDAIHVVLIAVMLILAIIAAFSVIRVRWEASAARGERCKKFRREFFDACLAAEPRYRCEVQWTQLGGRVFDSPPNVPWSDQLDCSKDFE